MQRMLCNLWRDEQGQDVAEYAMMLIIILLLAGVSVKLLGSNVRQVFAKTLVADASMHSGSVRDVILQDCEEAVRQQLDAGMRAEFPATAPEFSVHSMDKGAFRVESFVETRTADGTYNRIDYTCQARCREHDSCSVTAELRK